MENKNVFDENVEDLIKKELGMELSEEEKLIASLTSNNISPIADVIIPEKGDMSPVMVQSSYDPITGLNTPLATTQIDKDLEDIEQITKEFDFDPDKLIEKMAEGSTLTRDKLYKFVCEKFNSLPEDDKNMIVDVSMDHINKIPSNYYKKLPESIRSQINQAVAVEDHNTAKILRNSTAREFVDNLVDECIIQYGGIDINDCITEIQNVGKQVNDEIKGMETGFRINMITKIIDNYDKKMADDPTSKPNTVVEALRQAIDLTDFKEFCKTVRIKKFDIEKGKPYEQFNRKYYEHSLNIHDIRSCPTILSKHIKSHVDDNGVSKVCLAFCKYCINYTPDVPEQHMFMYYFIENIYLLDLIHPNGLIIENNNRSQEMMNFYHNCVSALTECIENIK